MDQSTKPLKPNDRTPKTGWYKMVWEKSGLPVSGQFPVDYRLIEGRKVPPTNGTGQGFVFVRYVTAAEWRRIKADRKRHVEISIARGLDPEAEPPKVSSDGEGVELAKRRLVEIEALMGVVGFADRLASEGAERLRARMKALKMAIASDLKVLGRAWRSASPFLRRLDLALHRARSFLSGLRWAGGASGRRCLSSLYEARMELEGFVESSGELG